MAQNTGLTYDQIYAIVRNGFTGDSAIWDQTFEYIRLHPNDLFLIAAPRKWSIGHQIIYHGALKLFQRLLPLYDEKTPINIHSPTKDTVPKTIRDIANERKGFYREQGEYIERLFAQDKFIQACKAYNWPLVDEMLLKDPRLLNEKPPYCSNYLIHYLAIYGDVRKFSQYNLPENRLQLDLQNADKKTAVDIARETNNQAVIDEMKSLLPGPRRTPMPLPDDRDERDDREEELEPKPAPPPPPPPHRPSAGPPPPHQPSACPPPTISVDAIIKRITCPLTKQIYVDPVIASDGQTYERQAIIDYIHDNRYSPFTGELIDETFIENDHTKNLILTLRQQNLLP